MKLATTLMKMKISKKQILLFALLFLAGGFLCYLFFFGIFSAEDPNVITSPLIGKPAYEFEFIDLNNAQKYNFDSFEDKVIYLNLWASWCIACRNESKTLNSFYIKNKDKDIVVVGIAVEDSFDNARSLLQQYPKSYPVGLDSQNSAVLLNYGVTGVPETFIIDKNKKIIKKFLGEVSKDQLEDSLNLINQN